MKRSLDWFEKNIAETRVHDAASRQMGRMREQKTVFATFRHETFRSLDPALYTHSVIANLLLGVGRMCTKSDESASIGSKH